MTDVFTKEEILFYKLWKSIIVYIGAFLCRVTYILYCNHPDSLNGELELDIFCRKQTKPSKSLKKLCGHNYFYEMTPVPRKRFNLSSCFKTLSVIKIGYTKLERSSNEKHLITQLFKYLEDMKKIRNRISHTSRYSEQDLQSFKEKLITLVENVTKLINDLKLKFTKFPHEGENVNIEFGRSTVEEIRKLWELVITEDATVQSYVDIYMSDTGRFAELVSSCRNELMDTYKYIATTPCTSFPDEYFKFSLDNVYVPVTINLGGKKLTYHEFVKKTASEESSTSISLVNGEHGQGKTAFCSMLAFEWTKENKAELQNSFDMVFLIHIKTLKESTLAQYLRKTLLPNSIQNLNISDEDLHYYLKDLRILILIDGYDKCDKANYLLSDAFDILSDKKYIITASPKYLESLQIFIEKTLELPYSVAQIKSFSDDDVKKFVKNISAEMKKINFNGHESLLNFFEELPSYLLCCTKNPFMILLLIFFWLKQLENPVLKLYGTVSGLYAVFFSFQKECAIKKIHECIRSATRSSENQKVDKILQTLAKFCYHCNAANNEPVFKDIKQQLQEDTSNEPIVLDIVFSTFFRSDSSLGHISRRNELPVPFDNEFINKSQFIHFASFHIFLSLLKEKCACKLTDFFPKNLANRKESSQIFAMTLGSLNKQNGSLKNYEEDILNILKAHSSNYDFLWNVLCESSSISFLNNEFEPSEVVVNVINSVIKPKEFEQKLNETNILSAISILQYVNIKVTSLNIEFSEDCDSFIPSYKRLQNMKLKRNAPINVKLSMKSKSEETTSEILSSLGAWAILKSFSGHLGISGLQILQKHLHSVETIDIVPTSSEVLIELNNLCRKLPSRPKLARTRLQLEDEEIFKNIPELHDLKGIIDIDVTTMGKETALVILKKLKPRKNKFSRVQMKLDIIDLEEVTKLITDLHEYIDVNGKLDLNASYDIEDYDLAVLQNLVLFKVNWDS